MSEKKNNRVLKVLLLVMGVCLVALGVYTVNFYQENKQNEALIASENKQLQQELEDLRQEYQQLMSEHQELQSNLKKEQDRIGSLVDSLKNSKVSIRELQRFRLQAELLKQEKERLAQTIDSLTKENSSLRSEIDLTHSELLANQKKMDSVTIKNQELTDKVKKASLLQLSNINGEAVVLRGNKEATSVKRASKAEQLRVCFTVVENLIIEPGERTLYLQVINPKNNLVGEKNTIRFNEKTLIFSAKNQVLYANEELDLCMLVNVNENDLIEGRYVVNIFDASQLIGSTSFELK